MGRLNNAPLTRVIELELEKQYLQAITHAVRYHAGWDRAEEAFIRLQVFKQGLAKLSQGATTPDEVEYKEAA